VAVFCLVGPPVSVGPVTVGGLISVERLGAELARAQAVPILLVVVAVQLSLVTRAARWQIYFLPREHVPFGPLLGTLAISYMASTFLPFRAGELVRALFLGRRVGIALPHVVGTILLEKLFDFLAVGVMLVMLLTLVPLPPPALVAAGSVAGVILIGFGFVVMLAVLREPTLGLVQVVDSHIPHAIGQRIRLEPMARHFAEGTDSLRSVRLWVPLVGWSAVTWVLSLVSVWAGALSLGVAPSLAAMLFVAILTSTGQAVPSSPGYVGVYHAAATLAWTAFGIDPPTAIAIAVITHAFSYGSLVITGLIALWTGGYTFGDVLSGISRRKTHNRTPAVALAPEP
jgi:glycosyltransferase 2 family protein